MILPEKKCKYLPMNMYLSSPTARVSPSAPTAIQCGNVGSKDHADFLEAGMVRTRKQIRKLEAP